MPAKRKARQSFPYAKVAQLWKAGLPIKVIAKRIKRLDKPSKSNPSGTHTVRNFIRRMHTVGYLDGRGKRQRLPHRISAATVKAATKAGFRANGHSRNVTRRKVTKVVRRAPVHVMKPKMVKVTKAAAA
jgi:hypothetical protein